MSHQNLTVPPFYTLARTQCTGTGFTKQTSSLEIFSLQFGVTVLVTRRLFVEPVVNFGLTDDAVDVVVGVNIPFQF
jgi:hypothetical protein